MAKASSGQVADPFGPFKAHLDALKAALEAAASPFRPLNNALDETARQLREASENAFKPLKPLTDSLNSLGKAWKDALKPVADFRAALGSALQPLRDARGAFDALTAPVRTFMALPGRIAGAVSDMASKAAGMLSGPASQLQNFFGRVQGQVAHLVELANPAAVQRFNYALTDLYATIGQTLTPVLNQFTSLARALGSALNGMTTEGKQLVAGLAAGSIGMAAFAAGAVAVQAALTGGIGPLLGAVAGALGGVALAGGQLQNAFKPVAEVLGGVFDRLGAVVSRFAGSDAFSKLTVAFAEMAGTLIDVGAAVLEGLLPAFNVVAELAKALAPAIAPLVLVVQGPTILAVSLLGKALEAVGPVLLIFAEAVTEVGKVVFDVARQFFSIFGVNLPELGKGAPRSESKDNTGAAVRNTSTTDVMSVLRAARESSFRSGLGAKQGPDYAQQTAGGVSTIAAEAAAIKGLIAVLTPQAIGDAMALKLATIISNTLPSAPSLPSASSAGSVARGVGQGILRANPITGPAMIAKDAVDAARSLFGR